MRGEDVLEGQRDGPEDVGVAAEPGGGHLDAVDRPELAANGNTHTQKGGSHRRRPPASRRLQGQGKPSLQMYVEYSDAHRIRLRLE